MHWNCRRIFNLHLGLEQRRLLFELHRVGNATITSAFDANTEIIIYLPTISNTSDCKRTLKPFFSAWF